MIRFTLATGEDCYLSPEDRHLLDGAEWRGMVHKSGSVYATRNGPGHSKQLLHRLVLDPPIGAWVEFIDGNSLNCARENLRLLTLSEVRKKGAATVRRRRENP